MTWEGVVAAVRHCGSETAFSPVIQHLVITEDIFESYWGGGRLEYLGLVLGVAVIFHILKQFANDGLDLALSSREA
jgi:hypothetical protein